MAIDLDVREDLLLLLFRLLLFQEEQRQRCLINSLSLFFLVSVEKMNFEVPLVTDMTPVEPPAGAAGKRYNAITQGWQGNDDEHPEVSGAL